MRTGCGGCLAVLLVLTATGGGLLLGARTVANLAREPALSGQSAQSSRKIDGLAARDPGPLVLTEAEVGALLARHLPRHAAFPLADPVVELRDDGSVALAGQVPARSLLTERPLSRVARILPEQWLGRPVWVSLEGRIRVERGPGEDRRYLRLEVDRFGVGRQRLPAPLLRLLLNPTTVGLLRWPLPPGIESVTVERGRATVRRASSR